jgi:hypothetical protein
VQAAKGAAGAPQSVGAALGELLVQQRHILAAIPVRVTFAIGQERLAGNDCGVALRVRHVAGSAKRTDVDLRAKNPGAAYSTGVSLPERDTAPRSWPSKSAGRRSFWFRL